MAEEGEGGAWPGTVCVCKKVFVGRNVLGWESSIPNHKTPSSKLCAHASPFLRDKIYKRVTRGNFHCITYANQQCPALGGFLTESGGETGGQDGEALGFLDSPDKSLATSKSGGCRRVWVGEKCLWIPNRQSKLGAWALGSFQSGGDECLRGGWVRGESQDQPWSQVLLQGISPIWADLPLPWVLLQLQPRALGSGRQISQGDNSRKL